MSHHIGQGEKKGMAKTCLPFQYNHVEGLWKNKQKKNTNTLRESGDGQMKMERGKRRKKKKKKEKQQQKIWRDRI